MATSLAASVRGCRFAFLKRCEVARGSVEAFDVTFRRVIARIDKRRGCRSGTGNPNAIRDVRAAPLPD